MIKKYKHSVIEYQKIDENIIDSIGLYLDNNANCIFEFFEINNKVLPIKIKVIPNKNEFDIAFNKMYNKQKDEIVPIWSVGAYKNNTIIMLSYNDYKNNESHKNDDLEYYKKTIVHEFVHYVNEIFNIEHNCSYTDKYLSEGVACYLSKQKENKSVFIDCNFDDIINNKHIKYDNYYILTKHLINNYDKSLVIELLQSSRQAREFLKNELFNKVK